MAEEVKLKECQLCHQMLSKDHFYKRKDRNGEYNWNVSYCGPCNVEKTKESRHKKSEHYKEYYKERSKNYYEENKDKYSVYQKKYYFRRLSPGKQVIYKQKIQDKYPDLVDKICV